MQKWKYLSQQSSRVDSAFDNFFLKQDEPTKGCLLAMRDIIMASDEKVTSAWKYGMPFFCYKGKMFCYLWIHKKLRQPYLGIVEGRRINHADLIIEGRSRMKIMLLDPEKDLPLRKIKMILTQALELYKNGEVKIR
jgi:hypothetical protein